MATREGIETDTGGAPRALAPGQAALKRVFDVAAAAIGLVLTFWLIAFAWLAATVDTRANGFFLQERVGLGGRRFHVIKLRTMRVDPSVNTNVTTARDARVTAVGRFLRRVKLDELPQLINVLKGDMSLVGPRPDVPGFADILEGDDRVILGLRPGITGPATLAYRDEETLLAQADDPENHNREVIWPDKVRLNREYARDWSLWRDLQLIWRTIAGSGPYRR